MPLDPSGLKDDLKSLAENPPAPPDGSPSSIASARAACAQAWADAMQGYAAAIIPASTTISAAASTLSGALNTAFATEAAAAAMESAFAAFAVTVGGGMAPAFVATPPPAPVGFATLLVPPFPETHEAGATAMKNAIDAWMKTGTATPSGGGSPVPWS